jgi:hypothetical protein
MNECKMDEQSISIANDPAHPVSMEMVALVVAIWSN